MLVFVLAMTSTAGVAAADNDSADAKVYAASFCVGRVNSSSVIDYWRGRTINLGAGGNWVDCPLVRDILGSGHTANAWVKVVDRHPSDNVSCGLWSQNVDSSDGWSGNVVGQSSSGSSTAVQTLNFLVLNNFSANSSYAMECFLPGSYTGNNSQIVAYSLTEN